MNEQRLLLKGKLSELKQRFLLLKNEGTGIMKQLSSGLNLQLHDQEITKINMEEITALTERLNEIHKSITEIKSRIKEIEEELE
jgi:hypothetical protein